MMFSKLISQNIPKSIPICLFLLVLIFAGCLGNLPTMQTTTDAPAATTETEEPSRPLAALQLSTPKTNYVAKEEIPLELNIQNGKFDLLVPFFAVATKGAFTQITVKDANQQIVEPKRAITQENPQTYVTKDGKLVRCIHGFDFKADANQELTLKDIQRYYQLQPGTYTITLAIDLEVYREFIIEDHPDVLELQRDLTRLQNDPNLQAAAKADAVNYYQEQIKLIKERPKEAVKDIYLPVKSRRGQASLVSNEITVTIE